MLNELMARALPVAIAMATIAPLSLLRAQAQTIPLSSLQPTEQKVISEIEAAIRRIPASGKLAHWARFYELTSQHQIRGVLYLTYEGPKKNILSEGHVFTPHSWRPGAYVVRKGKLPWFPNRVVANTGPCDESFIDYDRRKRRFDSLGCFGPIRPR